jgi:hypothetical protein
LHRWIAASDFSDQRIGGQRIRCLFFTKPLSNDHQYIGNLYGTIREFTFVEPHDEHCKKQIGAVEEQIIIKK